MHLFFSLKCISVAFLNGTGKETLLCLFRNTGLEETAGRGNSESDSSRLRSESHSQAHDSIVGLALDWLTNALYFCVDGAHPRLEVIDLKYRNYMQPSGMLNTLSSPHFHLRKKAHKDSWHTKRTRRSVLYPRGSFIHLRLLFLPLLTTMISIPISIQSQIVSPTTSTTTALFSYIIFHLLETS